MKVGHSGKPARDRLLDVSDVRGLIVETPGAIALPRMLIHAGNVGPMAAQGFYTLGSAVQSVEAAGLAYRLAPGANQTHSLFSPFGMPLGADRSLYPLSARRSRRYVWETVLSRGTIFAGVQCEIGLKDDALELSDASDNGIILQSLSTLNGGRWTLQTKRLGGGAVVTGADSGITPGAAALQHFMFDYFDQANPVLRILINGVVAYTVTGLANLPITNTGEGLYCLCITSGGSLNPGLGAEERIYDSRFYIEE